MIQSFMSDIPEENYERAFGKKMAYKVGHTFFATDDGVFEMDGSILKRLDMGCSLDNETNTLANKY